MIFNIPGMAADDSGTYKLISKTTLTVATKEVNIPLPSGYSRYKLTCYGYNTSRSNIDDGLYVGVKSGGTRRNATAWGGTSYRSGGSSYAIGIEQNKYLLLPRGNILGENVSEMDVIVDGNKTRVLSKTIAGMADSTGDMGDHVVTLIVKEYVYNYSIDELSIGTMNSAYTISAGSTFILEGMKE